MAERWPGERGVSEVIGFVFVFTLVLSSVTLVSVVGVGVLSDARNAEQTQNAERAFDVLADNVETVASGEAPRRATEIDLATAQLAIVDNVSVNVTATGGATTETVTRRVRPLRYGGEGRSELYYEAGAILRVDRNASAVLRSPSMIVDDDRAVVQIAALTAAETTSVGSSTVRVVTTKRNRTVDIEDRSGTFDRIVLNVTSPRQDAWQSVLEDAEFTSCRQGTDAAGGEFVACERTAASQYDHLYVATTRIDLSLDR